MALYLHAPETQERGSSHQFFGTTSYDADDKAANKFCKKICITTLYMPAPFIISELVMGWVHPWVGSEFFFNFW